MKVGLLALLLVSTSAGALEPRIVAVCADGDDACESLVNRVKAYWDCGNPDSIDAASNTHGVLRLRYLYPERDGEGSIIVYDARYRARSLLGFGHDAVMALTSRDVMMRDGAESCVKHKGELTP